MLVVLWSRQRGQAYSRLASEYELHSTQIAEWKKQLLDGGSSLFGSQHIREQQEQSAREAELFEQIGRLKMDGEWLKKS
jgi:putative transposase